MRAPRFCNRHLKIHVCDSNTNEVIIHETEAKIKEKMDLLKTPKSRIASDANSNGFGSFLSNARSKAQEINNNNPLFKEDSLTAGVPAATIAAKMAALKKSINADTTQDITMTQNFDEPFYNEREEFTQDFPTVSRKSQNYEKSADISNIEDDYFKKPRESYANRRNDKRKQRRDNRHIQDQNDYAKTRNNELLREEKRLQNLESMDTTQIFISLADAEKLIARKTKRGKKK